MPLASQRHIMVQRVGKIRNVHCRPHLASATSNHMADQEAACRAYPQHRRLPLALREHHVVERGVYQGRLVR